MSDQPQFEKIDAGNGTSVPDVWRVVVPGGWIYYLKPYHAEPCAVFVPKPLVENVRYLHNSAEAAK